MGSDVSEPLETLTAIYHNALAEPRLAPYIMANNTNNVGAATNEPLPTITTGNRNFCGAASFIQYHSEQTDREVRGQTLDAPVMTGDMSNRYALTSAHLIKYYKGDNYSAANAPLHTVTVKERNALIESHLCILRNNQNRKPLDEPMPTSCTSGEHIAEIRTSIMKYDIADNLGHWAKVRELLSVYCGYNV